MITPPNPADSHPTDSRRANKQPSNGQQLLADQTRTETSHVTGEILFVGDLAVSSRRPPVPIVDRD